MWVRTESNGGPSSLGLGLGGVEEADAPSSGPDSVTMCFKLSGAELGRPTSVLPLALKLA